MSHNIVLERATGEGDVEKHSVEFSSQINERLTTTRPQKYTAEALLIDKKTELCFLHWRDIVKNRPKHKRTATENSSDIVEDEQELVKFKYKYSSPFDTALFKDEETKEVWKRTLDECLGAAWKIPVDGRISLSFVFQSMFEMSDSGEYAVPKLLSFPWCHEKCTDHLGGEANSCVQNNSDSSRDLLKRMSVATNDSTRNLLLRKRLDHLKDFNKKQKSGLAFFVIDRDPCTGKEARYYLRKDPDTAHSLSGGKKGFQAVLDKKHGRRISNQAPWKRLILNQGLASLPPDVWDGGRPVYPYFTAISDSNIQQFTWVDLMGQHVQSHIELKRRTWNRSANPYMENRNGFHITFFELTKGSQTDSNQSRWPTGRLLSNDALSPNAGPAFQESAFTMFMQTPLQTSSSPQQNTFVPHPFFTVMLLVPEAFWSSPNEIWSSLETSSILRNSSAEIAEMDVIRIALGKVVERWIELNAYLETLLVEKFMVPEDYVKLLFDDSNFTRSQKYFWAIGCLSEFITSITDNKVQWDLYRAARVDPILHLSNAAALFNAAKIKNVNEDDPWNTENKSDDYEYKQYQSIVFKAQVYADTLADIKAQFESKLERVKALRDGLFNASALVESRASTRLGENVKLLTYVSIFYLPLAFCASIWAIPNIPDSKTTSSFVGTSIAVGIATYAIVFNIDTIASKLGRHYEKQKRIIIQQMQKESRKDWRALGQRFEEFKPLMEKKVPSEWWILVFVLRKLPSYVRASWPGKPNREDPERTSSISHEKSPEEPDSTPSNTTTSSYQNSQSPLTSGARSSGEIVSDSGSRMPGTNSFRVFKDTFQIQNPWKRSRGKADGEDLGLSSV